MEEANLTVIENEPPKIGRHIHVAGTTVGQHIDKCAICSLDLRDEIHMRVGENTSFKEHVHG